MANLINLQMISALKVDETECMDFAQDINDQIEAGAYLLNICQDDRHYHAGFITIDETRMTELGLTQEQVIEKLTAIRT